MGTVEKVNVEPPSRVLKPETEVDAEAEKSEVKPVVAPPALDAVIVHKMARLDRAGLMFEQAQVDSVVGLPNTANENVLPVMAVPPLSFSVITNTVVATAGAVTKKLKVAPPFVVASVTVPLPDGP